MIDKIRIIPMNIEHLEQVHKIEMECFTDAWSLMTLKLALSSPIATCIVACTEESEADNEVIGFAIMWILETSKESDILNMAVSPAYRGRGAGAALLAALIEISKKNNVEKITLEVRPNNTKAQKLYEKFGFKPIGRRKEYYKNPIEDAIIMHLNPIPQTQNLNPIPPTQNVE
jgi:ribosomal-protein-alanine N-acetyltransferase